MSQREFTIVLVRLKTATITTLYCLWSEHCSCIFMGAIDGSNTIQHQSNSTEEEESTLIHPNDIKHLHSQLHR